MPRHPKLPQPTCPRCGRLIAVLPIRRSGGRIRYMDVTPEYTIVFCTDGSAVRGFQRHQCPAEVRPVRKARKAKPKDGALTQAHEAATPWQQDKALAEQQRAGLFTPEELAARQQRKSLAEPGQMA